MNLRWSKVSIARCCRARRIKSLFLICAFEAVIIASDFWGRGGEVQLQNCTFYVSSDAPLQILIVRESNLQLNLHLNACFIGSAWPVEVYDLRGERRPQLHHTTQQPAASTHCQQGTTQYTRLTLSLA